MRRRLQLSILLFVCAVGTTVRAADPEFLRVWPAWRDAESFDRISEYFGRGENQGSQTILRTHPNARAGFYFLVRVKSAGPVAGAKFEVHVIKPDNPEAVVFSFPAAVPPKETVFQLGLTGRDWPAGEKAKPVAWKIALIGADGRTLTESKSFLWEKPAK